MPGPGMPEDSLRCDSALGTADRRAARELQDRPRGAEQAAEQHTRLGTKGVGGCRRPGFSALHSLGS